tara:strand:+ start:1460 stop:2320 length:861 start_codon:yes stop_codon:yes gene_type:complete
MQFFSKLLLTEYNAQDYAARQTMADALREDVETVAHDRNIYDNKAANLAMADYLLARAEQHCEYAFLDGEHSNVVAGWGELNKDTLLLGGHYDSPPGSPGADDNGSAIAVLLRLIEEIKNAPNVAIVFFNGEEHGLLGSYDFVRLHPEVSTAIILEMVGYFTDKPGTQKLPDGLPQFDVGDFLAIVNNRYSNGLGKRLMQKAEEIRLGLSMKNLEIPFGLESKLPGLKNVERSDHLPFWDAKKSAVMLTDTAEFRNHNYHQPTDTPDTLNYGKMAEVVVLLREFAS